MKLEILETGTLVFDAPFGDGPDQQVHVRAASSLERFGEAWLIAQDDSNFAAIWRENSVTGLRLFPFEGADTFGEARENKHRKPDVECITTIDIDGEPAAVFFGSGSTAARRRAAVVRRIGQDFDVRVAAIPSLYEAIEQATGLRANELNLESACALGDFVRFFQRGNAGTNGTFDVAGKVIAAAIAGARVDASQVSNWRRYELGSIDGAALAFTASEALPDGRILFAAAAEATESTYDDGTVAGSVIGILAPGGERHDLAQVPGIPRKIEGLALESPSPLVVRAVTDADDPARPAEWLRIRVLTD